MPDSQPASVTKVCVVGAGAAGLCAARHLAADSKRFEFSVFERQPDLGGTWIYTDKVGLDDDGFPVHSSMYRDLRTNLPKEIMSFPDFPEIKGSERSCVSHAVILEYLRSYAEHFQLRQHIKFHAVVESIKLKSPDSAREQWEVRVKDLDSCESQTHTFDAVMVCNGHYYRPRIPRIPGLSSFRGRLLHSHAYRQPEDFAGQTVLLLGAASSGIDIASELSKSASRVYLSHNKSRLPEQPLSFTEVAGIEGYADGRFQLRDGSALEADVLVLCTGYEFSYDFLDASCGIRVEENHVTPLYRHLVNAAHPSMCLVGLPMIVVPFPLFHVQVRYFVACLRQPGRLPAKEAMLEDARLKATEKRHAHQLHNAQWAYNEGLAREGGFEPLPAHYELGYVAWSALRREHLRDYKNFDLLVERDGRSVRLVDSRTRD